MTPTPATRTVTRSVAAALADLVLPVRCVGCGAHGLLLCPACMPDPATLRLRQVPGGPLVMAAGTYDGGLRQGVLAWKERGQIGLRRPLAQLLARAVSASPAACSARPSSSVLLVPVPSSRAARRARGGDQLARLTIRAGRQVGVRTVTGLLSLDRQVRDSAGLDRRERQDNLRGAFRARSPSGRRAASELILADDILTTGTTLREAHRALILAGWQVAGAAVVAETPLHA